MNDRFHPGLVSRRFGRAAVLIVALTLLLTACGEDDNRSGQIEWIPGTPPNDVAQNVEPTPDQSGQPTPTVPAEQPTDTEESAPPTATSAPEPTVAPTPGEAVTGRQLSPEELEEFAPNELGRVPVLEYHVLLDDPEQKAQFVNTLDDLRGDLQWLYDNNFYVIPLRDLIEDNIKAPAGKHPVVLTFDDSTVGQFRYLVGDDGTVTIDPNSGVGIMEAFYQEHPDFGRGGFFAVIPTDNFCFTWQLEEVEEDQYGYCAQKLEWLVANGYEVGNHTLNHAALYDTDDETFVAELGGAFEAIQGMAPDANPDILAMPFGQYPPPEKKEQRDMLRDGFSFDGNDYRLIGTLMVGSEPAYSPVNSEWDPVWIFRIQAWDDETKELLPDLLGNEVSLDDWFANFADAPELLYTSDGDPNTITIPEDVPGGIIGEFDESKAEGKEVVRY